MNIKQTDPICDMPDEKHVHHDNCGSPHPLVGLGIAIATTLILTIVYVLVIGKH